MGFEDLPDEFATLSRWLAEIGFSREDHGYERSFGDRMIEFKRGPAVVRLNRDRGKWYLSLGGSDPGTHHDIGIWSAYLGGTNASTGDVPAHGEEADFVRRYLPQIENAVRRDPELSARLGAIGLARNRKIVGLQ